MPNGFTLIELLVVISVISIISLAVLVGYPNVRAQQKLALAEQTLQAALRGAEQGAINEKRDSKCEEKYAAQAKLCSDIGVALLPAEKQILLFADTFDADKNGYEAGKDWPIGSVAFPEGVAVEPSAPPTVLIFEGAPPTIQLYAGTVQVKSFVPVTLRAGKATRLLRIGSYGQVEQ